MFSLPGCSTGSRNTARARWQGLSAIIYKTQSFPRNRKYSPSKIKTNGPLANAKPELGIQTAAWPDANGVPLLAASGQCAAPKSSTIALAPKRLPTIQEHFANVFGLVSLCGCSRSAGNGCIDDVEIQSDKLSPCNNEISRAKNSCTRIGHRL